MRGMERGTRKKRSKDGDQRERGAEMAIREREEQ
jgi:hypothetical protein